MGLENSVVYQEILARGEAKGEAKGKVEGFAEGVRSSILRLGRSHLGEPRSAFLAGLEEIDDVDRLYRIFDAVPQAKLWSELLAIP